MNKCDSPRVSRLGEPPSPRLRGGRAAGFLFLIQVFVPVSSHDQKDS